MSNFEVFEDLYSSKKWQVGISLSGPGSDPINAVEYVDFVRRILVANKVKTILDIGHGDWAMWPKKFFNDYHYTGIDLVKSLNDTMNKKHSNQNIKFLILDATTEDLPHADIVLVKDVLMHLSNTDISNILLKLKAYPLIIICQDVLRKYTLIDYLFLLKRQVSLRTRISLLIKGGNALRKFPKLENSDIKSGSHRFLNLEKSPWSLEHYGLKIIESKDYIVLPQNLKSWRCIFLKRIYLIKPN